MLTEDAEEDYLIAFIDELEKVCLKYNRILTIENVKTISSTEISIEAIRMIIPEPNHIWATFNSIRKCIKEGSKND